MTLIVFDLSCFFFFGECDIYSYEDLKPPTSPIPNSTTSVSPAKSKEVDATQVPVEANVVPVPDSTSNVPVVEVKQVEEKKERPLSPYAR